jgi:hypothetical protein
MGDPKGLRVYPYEAKATNGKLDKAIIATIVFLTCGGIIATFTPSISQKVLCQAIKNRVYQTQPEHRNYEMRGYGGKVDLKDLVDIGHIRYKTGG